VAIWYKNVDPNTPFSGNIGFNARTVLVDNYTAYWLYFPDADAYVPPFYGGVVLSLIHTTDFGRFSIQSPFVNPQVPVATSYFVHTVWTDGVLSPSPGVLIEAPGGGPPATDVTDRPGRLLGVISGTVSLSGTSLVDVVDDAGRLVGIVSVSGTVDTELPAAVALADATLNPTVPGVGSFGMVWNPSAISPRWERQTSNEPTTAGVDERAGTTTTANAAAVVTFAASVDRTNWLSGYTVEGLGATAASVQTLTITGLSGGTRVHRIVVPAGVAVALGVNGRLVVEFNRPWPASGPNTAIVGTLSAFGAGNTTEQLSMHGFLK